MSTQSWTGYGQRPKPHHWRLAAEYLKCEALHGDLFNNAPDVSQAIIIAEQCADIILKAADDIDQNATREACCYDRQRINATYERQRHQ